MTDGQSEACEANAEPSPERMHLIDRVRVLETRVNLQSRAIADLVRAVFIEPDDNLVAEAEADQAKHRELRRKIEYGQGLSLAEQRWVVEQLTGQAIPKHRRCGQCHGDGTVLDAVASAREGFRIFQTCGTCDGGGYTQ